jgi:hypothetical protein
MIMIFNGMIITQVHLVLGPTKGHSKMCSFFTQQNATDVSRYKYIQLGSQPQTTTSSFFTFTFFQLLSSDTSHLDS